MDKKFLIPAINERLEKIEALIKSLQDEKNELLKFLSDSNTAPTIPSLASKEQIINEYDASISWWEKTKYILKTSNMPMSTSEVVDYVMSKESNLDREKVVRLISHALTSNVDKGRTRRIGKGREQKFELI
ncbi:hypothetical protein HDC90_004791 [Pedobacter sp. AK013]|uniref:hypothetical protein n=1 Tax=Pedobacter sp. AK013 TaxID=2723071 RepID=UPI0016113341|nr:hypothetical protein [Pedobacter sp. AK013]MBB6240127.1 hypothetical protein [Pedobacter sp. AK013]